MVAEHLLDTENCSRPWIDSHTSSCESECDNQENLKCTVKEPQAIQTSGVGTMSGQWGPIQGRWRPETITQTTKTK